MVKSEKRIKKRGNKKDDFDYGKYIKTELKRLGYTTLEANKKKKLIQKIRNRKSAQRSRLRQKEILMQMERENIQLKTENQDLKKRISELEQANLEMRKM